MTTAPVDDAIEKRTRILDAAEDAFSAYGFARSSMADIAAGADMSRPALYQHFANKEEIFAAMLDRLLTTAADAAIDALDSSQDLATALDGFLQHWAGDLTERFRATQHGADFIEAKQGHARSVIEAIQQRVHGAVSDRLTLENPSAARTLTDLVLLSPTGLKADGPSMAVLRQRLTGLAEAVAAASA
jgi:AcrR family transcriptional regulator